MRECWGAGEEELWHKDVRARGEEKSLLGE